MIILILFITDCLKEKDVTIYNEAVLKYAPLLLVSKSVCKDAYHAYEKLQKTIDKYMLCANGAGNLDDTGDLITKVIHKVDGCLTKDQRMRGLRGVSVSKNLNESIIAILRIMRFIE